MKKKDKGMIDHFLPAILTMLFLLLIWFGFTTLTGNIDRSTEIHQVARRYMLRMESDGYLTPENKNMLVKELEALGVKNINLNGTNLQDVGYGNKIRLCIKGMATIKTLELQDILSAKLVLKEVPLEINKTSIAKN